MRATNPPKPEPAETLLRALRDSWVLSLQARNLSPKTIRLYRDVANDFLRYLDATEGPGAPEDLVRAHVDGFLADMVTRGMSPSTVSLTYRALQQWMKWLDEEDELETNPMAKMTSPIVPDIPVPVVPDGDLKRLVEACAGRDFV